MAHRFREYDVTTGFAFGIAVLIGTLVTIHSGVMNGVFTILVISGAYLAIDFYLEDRKGNAGGPSELGAAMMGGLLLTGIGLCGFVYTFTEDVAITVVCLIVVMVASSAVLFYKYKKYL